MSRHRHLLIGLLALGLALAPATARAQDDPLDDLARRPLKGSIKIERLRSKVLRKKALYSLYLPPGYSPSSAPLPWVLLLHGLYANEQRWILRGGPQIVEGAILDGRLPPLVVVVPEGGAKGFWIDGAAGKESLWQTYLVDEVVPHVQKTWRIRSDRAGRYVVGMSSGGYGALSLAFSRPALFAGVAAHAPLLLEPSVATLSESSRKLLDHLFLRENVSKAFGSPLSPEVWASRHPENLARTLTAETGLRIWIGAAKADRFGGAPGTRRLHEVLEKARVPHGFATHVGDQGWGPLREYLPQSLSSLLGRKDRTQIDPGRKNAPDGRGDRRSGGRIR